MIGDANWCSSAMTALFRQLSALGRDKAGTHALPAPALLQHLEDVSGRVLEPGGDEWAAAAGNAALVLVHPVVPLELDARLVSAPTAALTSETRTPRVSL
jgi:hypothetical protein